MKSKKQEARSKREPASLLAPRSSLRRGPAVEDNLLAAKPILLKALRKEGVDFSFYVVPNREMEELRNIVLAHPKLPAYERRKIEHETVVNVLSFPAGEGFPVLPGEKTPLGEIYLNRDFEGGAFGILGPLLVHGLLHLLGYRHHAKRDTMKMEKLEKKLWQELMAKLS